MLKVAPLRAAIYRANPSQNIAVKGRRAYASYRVADCGGCLLPALITSDCIQHTKGRYRRPAGLYIRLSMR